MGLEPATCCSYRVLPNDYTLEDTDSVVNEKLHWNPVLSPRATKGKADANHSEHASSSYRSVVKLAATRIDTGLADPDAQVNDSGFLYRNKTRPKTEKPVRMSTARQKYLNRLATDKGSAQSYMCTNDSESGLQCRNLRPEKEGNVESLQHLRRPVPIFSFLLSMGKAGRKLASARPRPAPEKQRPKSEVDVSMQKLASFVLSGCNCDPETPTKHPKAQPREKPKKKGPSVASGVHLDLLCF